MIITFAVMPLKEKTIERMYWSIGEVADTLGVNTSLLRYWEKEFGTLRPKRTNKGDRLYTKDDIATIRGIQRKGQGEQRSLSKPRLHSERTAVCLRDPLTDCQAKTEATSFGGARSHPIRPPESFKNMRQIGRSDTCAGVAHRKRNVIRMATKSEVHSPAGRRVLDCVCYKIQEQLPEPRAIPRNGYFR